MNMSVNFISINITEKLMELNDKTYDLLFILLKVLFLRHERSSLKNWAY